MKTNELMTNVSRKSEIMNQGVPGRTHKAYFRTTQTSTDLVLLCHVQVK